MFSGIVKGHFPIRRIQKSQNFLQYAVELPKNLLHELEQGASIAIDGVCQTVVKRENDLVFFDAMGETLSRTTLDALEEGSEVNVERSIRFGDEVGGHLLSGHVFGTATISHIERTSNNQVNEFQCSPEWMKYILPKGYIAVDGASLTIVDVDPTGAFTVHLIPETLRITNLGRKEVGDRVNIEFDSQTQAIVDTVERILKEKP